MAPLSVAPSNLPLLRRFFRSRRSIAHGSRVEHSENRLVWRQPRSRLHDLDQHIAHLPGHVTGTWPVRLGRIRGSLGLEFLDGDSNPPEHRRMVILRAKGAANDRAEAWRHRVAEAGDCDGVSPSDRSTEITEFLVLSMHVGCSRVYGQHGLGKAAAFAVRPGPRSQTADCDTGHEPCEQSRFTSQFSR